MEPAIKTPWESYMGDVPMHLTYDDLSMVELVEKRAKEYPNNVALIFMGKKVTYSILIKEIEKTAKALLRLGVKAGDRVTIAMPNSPQAIYMFYAVNKIGAVSNMIHVLSAEKEIAFYLKDSQSDVFLTLDAFYEKFLPIIKENHVHHFILASIRDELTTFVKIGYDLTSGKKVKKLPKDLEGTRWKDFLCGEDVNLNYSKMDRDEPAVILYSGGTTGTTKGILLSNYNFNALAKQIIATNPMFRPGDKMLAAMPIFHGFGLGVCIHSMLANGGCCVLIPRFTAESYAKDILKYHCNFIAGVPTLFEALLHISSMDGKDLSSLKGVFSGGDSLSIELKKKFDEFLKEHHAKIQIREGYGATECVTASCLTPLTEARAGSIGIPFPDTYYRIVKCGTDYEVPYGEEGEIVLAGPTVMLGYANHEEETKNTLHNVDGKVWLHTGDLGYMDKDGYIYFRGREKRMIVSSGYNIYPAQLENILDAHEAVKMSCIIGVPDPYKMRKVKAFVALNDGYVASEELKESILQYAQKYIAKYAMPYDIEFCEDLPKTLVGKVAYRVLEEEEMKRLKQNEE